MAPRRSFLNRLTKAVHHRRRKVRNWWGALRPAQTRTFFTPSALRQFAMSADGATQKVNYRVTQAGSVLPQGPRLRLAQLRTVHIHLHDNELHVSVVSNTPIPEGRIAWAIAEMLQPSVAPHADSGLDYLPSPNDTSTAASATAAVGRRIKFGDYHGTPDAIALEYQHASPVSTLHTGRIGFDPLVFNPIGLSTRELNRDSHPADVHITSSGPILINGKHFGAPSDRSMREPGPDESWELAVSELKRHRVARVSVEAGADASILAGMAATGIVMSLDPALDSERGATAQILSSMTPELAKLISTPLASPEATKDILGLMARSAQQRRLALLHHGMLWRAVDAWPLVSVLLASNRPTMLNDALSRVLAQTYPNLEVHIALHGVGDVALADTLRSRDARVQVHSFDEGLTLGAVYGELTARANGTFLAKMDDDDFYSEHHVWELMMAARYSGAALVGRVPTLTWLADERELLLRSFGPEERYGVYVAGAAMLIRVDALRDVGGWRPSPWAEDKALIDRFADSGLVTYRAGQLGWAAVRHSGGHTWQRDHQHFRDLAETSWQGHEAQALLAAALA